MNEWSEVKTAYEVARLGTVSAAADELGVHRATVLRHIDSLETRLGVKLFIRHSKGYMPTELGHDLFRLAQSTDEQLTHFVKRSRGHGAELTGDLTITSLGIVAPLLLPAIKRFQSLHPKIRVRYLTSGDVFKLEFGQAHIAIRTGVKSDVDDYVVQPFFNYKIGLYAHKDYVDKHGMLPEEGLITGHGFISNDDLNIKIPIDGWMKSRVAPDSFVLASNSQTVQKEAVLLGMGIGVLLEHEARAIPELLKMYPLKHDWQVTNWVVTYGDLHRTEKIQAFLSILKSEDYRSEIASWLKG